jgi:hypothetical protein
MTITGPNNKYSTAPDNYSEFVVINNFVFRPKQVEAFYRQEAVDGLRTTTVIFPPNRQTIPDPEWSLYDFLFKRTHPMDAKDFLH